ncbi:MAG: hypothetical protein A2900_02610 [Candidatus Chisholmbacteria bacterium RIFCSPLOWO2_01_FULL_50_28]|uniref:Uncharacterized protein n=1 Tax=Candidatus Chisholmbacteria bacterium RIFCSPHIGHO2_01_FULL_52_32 TaxID=1797591 RepID=A0A1G1VTH5_9BACT|nr:MAG: hypothetical protein A2786_04135 [Candidatus Chisholmbacteria bacterium RIFCSPHIGHO2_01_FULL_52_32]OGY19970.1 MAG: hypothetical protein A2900_02610 [Candidatus Chisholmbacteria bacterium RIFCSPLOWO2_01_FULL_50_28]
MTKKKQDPVSPAPPPTATTAPTVSQSKPTRRWLPPAGIAIVIALVAIALATSVTNRKYTRAVEDGYALAVEATAAKATNAAGEAELQQLKTQVALPTLTAVPTLDPSLVQTASLPNFCFLTDITQEDIDGEYVETAGVIWQNAAIGAADCAAEMEGRWFEGFSPSEDHHITAFFGAAENVSVYQGTQWQMPVGAKPRDILHGLATGKCNNWDDAKVSYEPIVFDYVDMKTMQIVHQDSSCEDVRAGNPLPEEIGLVPGEQLPHFNLGYTWGGLTVSGLAAPASSGTFSGVSKFDTENRGMVCNEQAGPALGDNANGIAAINPAWDPQCIYVIDASKSPGGLNGHSAIGLIRGQDIAAAAATFDASVWGAPADWVATDWAKDFARDNCPANLPILTYEGVWTQFEVFTCP